MWIWGAKIHFTLVKAEIHGAAEESKPGPAGPPVSITIFFILSLNSGGKLLDTCSLVAEHNSIWIFK